VNEALTRRVSRGRSAPLFGLAPDGVCRAKLVTQPAGELLPHRFTLTAAFAPTSRIVTRLHRSRRFAFCGTVPIRPALCALRTVGVTHHRALWSPDFPPRHDPVFRIHVSRFPDRRDRTRAPRRSSRPPRTSTNTTCRGSNWQLGVISRCGSSGAPNNHQANALHAQRAQRTFHKML
jgi:hypothetical protein